MSRYRRVSSGLVSILLAAFVIEPVRSQMRAPARDSYANASISDENLALIATQTRDLKNPTFRALLRVRMLSWVMPAEKPENKQAALDIAIEGLSDLSAHQEEVWRPTAGWLYESLTKAVRNLDPAGAEVIIGKYPLKKDERVSDAERDLATAVNLLADPATAAGAAEKAKAAIMTGQVPAGNLLGHFLRLQKANPACIPELLSAMLITEEQHPGFISVQFMSYFARFYLEKSNAPEFQARFLLAAIRSTRVSPEELANVPMRSRVVLLLRQISEPVKALAPALYPELANRLNSLGAGPNSTRTQRQEAEERIRASSDQLEQIQTEADKTADRLYQRELLARAAQKALELGKLRKAVDLIAAGEAEKLSETAERFLAEVNRAAIKQNQPDISLYAIAKMVRPLPKANALITLSKYFAELKDAEKGSSALNEAAQLIRQTGNDKEKIRSATALAQCFLAFDRAAAHEAFRQLIDTINKLPAPEKEKEQNHFVSLMPVAEELITVFRAAAASDAAGAMALAQEIKLPELRVSAMSGVYSKPRPPTTVK